MTPADEAQAAALSLSLMLDAMTDIAESIRALAASIDGETLFVIRSYVEQSEIKMQAAIQATKVEIKSL
jgi:hypothetical protein